MSSGLAQEPRPVLLIRSFGREFAPFDTFTGHFRTELARQFAEPVDIYEVSLEIARLQTPAPEEPFLEYVRALFEGRRLDLVVPIGGPGVRFAQRHRAQLFPETPMLLAAVDKRHIDDSLIASNDTAVAVRNDFRSVMDTILALLPGTINVSVVIGNSPLEQFWLEQLQREFEPWSNRVRFDWRELQRWSIPEARLPADSLIHFRQPTLWETHKRGIIAIVGVCLVEAILILLLLANLMKRRRAEQALLALWATGACFGMDGRAATPAPSLSSALGLTRLYHLAPRRRSPPAG